MEAHDPKCEAAPVILIVERRKQRQADLSAADVMKILRKRATLRRQSHRGSGGANGAQ